jgi:hypothetical protein
MAIFGWSDPAMAMLYTKEADRRRASLEAAHKPREKTQLRTV